MRSLKSLLMLAACIAAPVAAEPLNDGLRSYGRKDFAAAMELLRPLAEKGDPVAEFMLGNMYDNGHGVPQDDAAAMAWYRKAAGQGSKGAAAGLGRMYETGRGVPVDDAAAATWYRTAADQGVSAAQFNLGNLCASGRGVPQDYVEAYKWLDLAATGFVAWAKEKFDLAIASRDAVALKMTPAQIAEAQRLARDWVPKPERLSQPAAPARR
jgi:hypothetical protein